MEPKPLEELANQKPPSYTSEDGKKEQTDASAGDGGAAAGGTADAAASDASSDAASVGGRDNEVYVHDEEKEVAF